MNWRNYRCQVCGELVTEDILAEETDNNEDEMVVLASTKLCPDCYWREVEKDNDFSVFDGGW